MYKRYARIAGKKTYDKFEEKEKLKGLEPKHLGGYTVVYQTPKGILIELDGFVMSDDMKKGVNFKDGSRLLIKGWMKVIRVGGCFQLFPLNGHFGFCYGPNEFSSSFYHKLCDHEKLATNKETRISYLIDEDNLIIYEVAEYIFDENPETFDLFNGKKRMVLFKDGSEYGFIQNGVFGLHDPRGSTVLHPMADWWIHNA